jgi:PAS domain S-box-containing protein
MQTVTPSIDALTVLIIEDNPDDAIILENHLLQILRKKITLVFKETLKAGLSRLSQGDIDIVFLDLSLPDSDGLKSLIKIRDVAPLIPVIVLTGRNDYDLSLQSLRMSAQDYLLKCELSPSVLERSIDYARERQRGAEVSDFLASLVQSSADAIIGRSLDGKIVSWNMGAEKMYGYKASEVIGQTIGILVPEDRLGELTSILEKTKSDMPIDTFETVRVRKDGSLLPVSCSVSTLRNSEGLPTGAVIVARDITARLLAEKDLKESNERLHLAVQAANVGIWSWDTRGDTIIWDERMLRFFGRSTEGYPRKSFEFFEIALGTFMEIVHPEDRAKVSEALAKALEQNCNYACSYRIIWPDSSLHFIEASGVLSFEPGGERSNMIGVCMDVTERTNMERNIREVNSRREQIAGAIVQHAPVGIVTLDSKLCIVDVNSAFATIAGRQVKELLLKTLGDVLPEAIFQKARQSIKTGSSFQIFRHKIVLPEKSSESSRYWDLSFWPVLASQGATAGAILQVTDCTSAVMLEQQREDFVAAVAHDIKNPLIGAARMLDHLCSQPEGKSGHGIHNMLNLLRDSVNGLLALVQNLVDVHQYETLGYPIVCSEINLHNMMVSCIKQNSYLCDSRQVTIQLEEMSAPLIISGDYIGLSRVFMNLLHNAVKFSRKGSSIEVEISSIDIANVEISVSDTGDGISIADQKKLFQRYGQAEAGRRKANSTGLGLYLSRQIVQSHCGQIGCKSEVGRGSTFFVRLPVRQNIPNKHSSQTNNHVVAKVG